MNLIQKLVFLYFLKFLTTVPFCGFSFHCHVRQSRQWRARKKPHSSSGRTLGIWDWCSQQGRPKMSKSEYYILAGRCPDGQKSKGLKSEVQITRSPKDWNPKARSLKSRILKARSPKVRSLRPESQRLEVQSSDGQKSKWLEGQISRSYYKIYSEKWDSQCNTSYSPNILLAHCHHPLWVSYTSA